MIEHPFLEALSALWARFVLGLSTFGVTLLISANSLFAKVRMSHDNGYVLRGRLRIAADARVPDHDFFVQGRSFACRVRHGAASFKDDAKLVVRSASIKFADQRGRSPLDILMNTGRMPLFWNARTFMQFMRRSIQGKGKHYVSYLQQHPQAAIGGGDSVRRDPDTPHRLVYWTQTTSGFIGLDQVFRYVRYRLVPVPFDGTETGMPDDWDRHHAWLQNPLPDETRGRNYLKDAVRETVESGQVMRYRLQIQLRLPPPDEKVQPEWISASVLWDETMFPWLDLADLELVEMLSHKESMLTWFDLCHHPASLPIPKARSIDDAHSLNHLRLAGIWATRARLLSYALTGVPKPYPDSRQAKDWIGVPPMANPP
jgi:arachidonate 5-lipoxygenase